MVETDTDIASRVDYTIFLKFNPYPTRNATILARSIQPPIVSHRIIWQSPTNDNRCLHRSQLAIQALNKLAAGIDKRQKTRRFFVSLAG